MSGPSPAFAHPEAPALKRRSPELQRRLLRLLVWGILLGIWSYVLIYPFSLVRYPPLTDLPFHAANTSILKNYSNPAFGFKEQFEINALAAPYMSLYVLGAALNWLMPLHLAVKAASVLLLSTLPLGLALLFRGLGKPAILGALGFGLIYTSLTHWGFVSHLGALGFCLCSWGSALLLLKAEQRRARRLWAVVLLHSLVLTLVTHVYRFPFAIAGVLLFALIAWFFSYRKTIGLLLAACIPSALLFVFFLLVRNYVLASELSWEFEPARLKELGTHLFGGFRGQVGALERENGWLWLGWVGVLVLSGWLMRSWKFARRGQAPEQSEAPPPKKREASYAPAGSPNSSGEMSSPELMSEVIAARSPKSPQSSEARLNLAAHAGLALIALGLLGLYITLPLTWGNWFFVYPREALTLCFVLVALLVPALPKLQAARLGFLLITALIVGKQAHLVSGEWLRFERTNQDFYAIQRLLPERPKLLYLVFEHQDSYHQNTPFIHLPAWIQAELGGALYFHFVRWELYPIKYRADSEAVPPTLPHFLEWRPDRFSVLEHGPWFDTFLVRHRLDPSQHVFGADPTIRLVAREGTWWLYRREGAPTD